MDFNPQNYNKQISKFTLNGLINIKQKDLEKLMRWIVDYKANSIGLPSICKVKIKNLSINGKFNPISHELQIAKGLAVKLLKPPFDKTAEHNILAHKELFETLMHEFWHAAQQYAREHPECVTKEQFEIINLNYQNYNGTSIYFKTFNTCDSDLLIISDLLYCIQPTERQAFLFANSESFEFNKLMHKIYPNDLSFGYHDCFSHIQEKIEEACVTFETETPCEDIDDIIRVLNGIEPHNDINPIMWKAVLDTQPHIKEYVITHNIELNNEELTIERE